jgi:galactose mutarotase-like enzyme
MARLTTQPSGLAAVGDLFVLEDERAHSRVELAPARGGLVTSFSVAGRELLYMDPTTLADASKSVRGGIPVLFPSPGKLVDDRFTYAGKSGAMKQHGFARSLPWTAAAHSGDEASVRLTLCSSALTRAQFPWEFRYDLTFTLEGTRLSLFMRVHNSGDVSLPCALGFHPYFYVAHKEGTRVETRATTAFDNVSKQVIPYRGVDFAAPEQDLYLLDHGSSESALVFADGARIELRASSEFTRWVVWTLAGKDYVCVEPWTALPDALNSGEELLQIAPGASHDASLHIELRA